MALMDIIERLGKEWRHATPIPESVRLEACLSVDSLYPAIMITDKLRNEIVPSTVFEADVH